MSSDSEPQQSTTESQSGPQEEDAPGSATRPATNVQPNQMSRFITEIKKPTQQVGEHVLAALKHPNTMAVLTTVVVGPSGRQHVVSAALNPTQTAHINALLQHAAEERVVEEPCVGFHCLVKPKNEDATDQAEG